MSRERLRRAESYKENLADIKTKISAIQNYLRALQWEDLPLTKVHHNSETKYAFNFPETIKTSYAGLEQMVTSVDNDVDFDPYNFYHYAVYGDTADRFNTLNIGTTVEDNDNRIHMPSAGIAMNLRNLGIGIKMYKYVMADLGYITSTESDLFGTVKNSLSSDLVWHSLNKDPEVHVQTHQTKIIAVLESDRENFTKIISNYLRP